MSEETTPSTVDPEKMSNEELDKAAAAMADEPNALDTLAEGYEENNKPSSPESKDDSKVDPPEKEEEKEEVKVPETKDEAKRDSNFKRLLTQRNEARNKVEDVTKSKDDEIANLRKEIADNKAEVDDSKDTEPDLPDNPPDDIDAKIAKAVKEQGDKRDKQAGIDSANHADKADLLRKIPEAEEHMEEIEEVMDVHKTLTFEQALRMISPTMATKLDSAPNAGNESVTSMSGSESSDLSKDLTADDMTQDQREKHLMAEEKAGRLKI